MSNRATRSARLRRASRVAPVGVAVLLATLVPGWSSVGADPAVGPVATTDTPGATETPTPTPTCTPDPGDPNACPDPPAQRTVSLETAATTVKAKTTIELSGVVDAAEPQCESEMPVVVRLRVLGTTDFKDTPKVTTDETGAFGKSFPVQSSAEYVAVASGHRDCAEATSDSVTVLAKALVSAEFAPTTPERGKTLQINGKVIPSHAGSRTVLQRRDDGEWVFVKKGELDSQSRFRFSLKARWKGRRVFRVRWRSIDEDHETGHSPRMKVKTQAPKARDGA